jgi:hypothetical protein
LIVQRRYQTADVHNLDRVLEYALDGFGPRHHALTFAPTVQRIPVVILVAHAVQSQVRSPVQQTEHAPKEAVQPAAVKHRPMREFVGLRIECKKAAMQVQRHRHECPLPGSEEPVAERAGRTQDRQDADGMPQTA